MVEDAATDRFVPGGCSCSVITNHHRYHPFVSYSHRSSTVQHMASTQSCTNAPQYAPNTCSETPPRTSAPPPPHPFAAWISTPSKPASIALRAAVLKACTLALMPSLSRAWGTAGTRWGVRPGCRQRGTRVQRCLKGFKVGGGYTQLHNQGLKDVRAINESLSMHLNYLRSMAPRLQQPLFATTKAWGGEHTIHLAAHRLCNVKTVHSHPLTLSVHTPMGVHRQIQAQCFCTSGCISTHDAPTRVSLHFGTSQPAHALVRLDGNG